MACEPLHWLSYGNDGNLLGLGLLKRCNPARLTIASPDGLAWRFWTTRVLSTPRRLSGGSLLQPVRGWVQDAKVGGDGGGGHDGGSGSGSGLVVVVIMMTMTKALTF